MTTVPVKDSPISLIARPRLLVFLVVLAAIVSAAGSYKSGAGADLGYSLGYALVPAVALWAAYNFSIPKPRRRLSWAAALLIYGAGVASACVVSWYATKSAAASARHIAATLDAVADGKTPPNGVVAGPLAPFEEYLNRVAADQAADTASYEREIEATGFPDLVKPDRFSRYSTEDAARAVLDRIRSIIAEYRTRNLGRIDRIRPDIGMLPMDAGLRAQALAGLDKALAGNRSVAVAFWDNQMAMVDAAADVNAALREAKGRWKLGGGQVAFTSQEDLTRFNGAINRINILAAKETELLKESVEQKRAGALKLRNLAAESGH